VTIASLSRLLANRRWLRRSEPFSHVVARDVFIPAVYQELADQIQTILDRGLSETADPTRFSRSIPGYDSYGIGFDGNIDEPLSLFLSPGWRDMLSSLFGIGSTPYVFAGSHHHSIGSASGFIHNDFNTAWFPIAPNDAIQTPRNDLCAYKTGRGVLDVDSKIEVVRGAVIMFYLLNDEWCPQDGGETGLFSSASSKISEPDSVCPPINNSLVAFECSPSSFHAFLANKRAARTSIIMWVHRDKREAAARFGSDRLERWLA